ncbi:hypothetical protein SAMN05421819_1914 [Bryocella elongata]|uniref:Uncharacterized protein n=1 Tax=Bryocella elongata TaxID=863522 RepID=A0A1H5XPR6_9BACT|nr:hypothetical protein SAMN05421819_1914 [Bryocella elongata]
MQPLFSTSARSAYKSLLSIAVGWGGALVLFGLLTELSGYLGPWRELGVVLLSYWWIWLGPLALALGASLGLRGRWNTASISAIWVGCLSLTAMMLYLLVALVRDAADPLIAKPSLDLVVFLIVSLLVALWSDATALRLSRKAK